MGRRNRGNNIPDGWNGCPSMGTGFIDDRFFVFKTPLKQDLNSKVPQSQRFSIENVFQRVEQMNHVSQVNCQRVNDGVNLFSISRIGLWIDLTNTSRYYNPAQIQNRGVHYQKLACEGHGKPPSKRTVYAFCHMVHHFFRQNRRDYIGVHCTHGFNRTGFLICCYLIQFRKYTAAEAVQEFSRHRQPGIYRQIYVNELYTMSRPIEIPIQVSQPNWLIQQSPAVGLSGSDTNNQDNSDKGQTADNSQSKSGTSAKSEESHHLQHSSRLALSPTPTTSKGINHVPITIAPPTELSSLTIQPSSAS